MGMVTGVVSLILLAGFAGLTRFKMAPTGGLLPLIPLIIPLSVGIVSGFSPPIVGMILSLLLFAAGRWFGKDDKFLELSFFLLGALVFAWFGFRIQFIQIAPQGRYIYFSWLSVPLTVAWLLLVSRSVEFAHLELGDEKPHLFLGTVLVIGISFVSIVALQPDQGLDTAYQLGLSLVLTVAGLMVISPEKRVTSIVSRQLGFILAGLALIGVVKSLTAFILLVPIAPLALPAASKSMAFTRSATASEPRPSLVDGLASKYVGSRELGIAIFYISLSVVGLTSIWFLMHPGMIQAFSLAGSFALPALLVLAGKGAVDYLENWKPSIRRTSQGSARIFGTSFNSGRIKEAREKILKLVDEDASTNYVATPDVTAVVQAEDNRLLDASFSRADVVTPDGFGLIWAASLHDLPLTSRVAGIDLIDEILASPEELDVYLLGSRKGVAKEAGSRMEAEYEGVEIVGTHHGYIPVDQDEVVSEINRSGPDILLVGMGVPKQERWITKNIEKLDANVVMGVGGSFDVISGNLSRAPRWMRDRGLEWLYRIWLEPGRLAQARWIPYFMFRVLWEKGKCSLREEIL
ncbi:MAG: WecB/TagA/CpsF family glycosyltransferase [Candidatus Bipolaricaulota bacterium]